MNHTSLSPQQFKKSSISIFFFICITLSASMILYSCSGSSTDSDSDPNGSGNGNGDGTTNDTSPTFDNVGQIFLASCGDCHTSQQESGVRLNTYDNVINSVGAQYGEKVVNPGSADTSPLMDKISSSNPQFGVRMPEGGTPLTSARIDQIRTWINNGANDDVSEGNNNDGGY